MYLVDSPPSAATSASDSTSMDYSLPDALVKPFLRQIRVVVPLYHRQEPINPFRDKRGQCTLFACGINFQ